MVIIDVTNIDFLQDKDSYNQIVSALNINYNDSITHLNLENPNILKKD